LNLLASQTGEFFLPHPVHREVGWAKDTSAPLYVLIYPIVSLKYKCSNVSSQKKKVWPMMEIIFSSTWHSQGDNNNYTALRTKPRPLTESNTEVINAWSYPSTPPILLSSVFSVASRLHAGRSAARISVRARDFSLLQKVQNGSETHSISYSMCTGVLSRGVRQPEREVNHSSPRSVEVKIECCPCMS